MDTKGQSVNTLVILVQMLMVREWQAIELELVYKHAVLLYVIKLPLSISPVSVDSSSY